MTIKILQMMFQSPQWGDNSKVATAASNIYISDQFQSPQWGDNSKVRLLN